MSTKPAPHHALLLSAKPTKSRWCGYYELTRLHKPVLGNTLMFWPCGTVFFPSPFTRFVPLMLPRSCFSL